MASTAPFSGASGRSESTPPQSNVASAATEPALPDFELESAIARGSASFDQWVQCYFFCIATHNDDEPTRLRYRNLVKGVYEAFEKHNGPITKSLYGLNFVAATALTEREVHRPRHRLVLEPTLHVLFNPSDTAFEDAGSLEVTSLLYRCKQLSTKANQFLSGQDLEVCLDMIFTLVTDLLAFLDERVARRKKPEAVPNAPVGTDTSEPVEDPRLELLPVWRAEYDRIIGFYSRSCRRRADAVYFGGMLLGLMTIAGAGVLVAIGLMIAGASSLAFRPLASLAAGALGAMVSVMIRMTRGKLGLNPETDRRAIRNIGFFRPVLGAVFGLFLYAILASGLLPVSIPKGDVAQAYFFAAVSFVAGFSERFAKDVVARTAQGIGLGSSNEHEVPSPTVSPTKLEPSES